MSEQPSPSAARIDAALGAAGPQAAQGLCRPGRIVIVQAGLGQYRVPFFRELARRPNVSLRVVYGDGMGVPNVSPEGFEGEQVPLRRVQVLGQPLYWQPAHLRELRKGVDVMIASWDVHYLSLLPALAGARRRGIGMILWGHGYSKRETRLRRGLRMWLGKRADAVLVYNRAGAKASIEGGIPESRVFVALNTIDTSVAADARRRWLAAPQRLEAWRRDHGLGGPAILHVARHSPQRRIDLLLLAVSRLRSEFPTLKLVLIGQGYDGAEVLGEIERNNLAGAVIRSGSIYDEDQLAPYFLSARALAFPADIGLSLHHAFAYGLPVVTHGDRASQAPELEALEDGVNGLLFRKDDADDLAAKLAMLLADDSLAARLGEAARKTLERDFSLARMADGFITAIEYVRERQKHSATA